MACLGMLFNLDVSLMSGCNPDHDLNIISWNGEQSLQNFETGYDILKLPQRLFNVLTTLAKAEVDFEFRCHQSSQPHEKRSGLNGVSRHHTYGNGLELSIVLYSPGHIVEAVGNWLDECRLYLQKPTSCKRNVPYRNPHSSSYNDEDCIMTDELFDESPEVEQEDQEQLSDIFAQLDKTDDLIEASQPALISTPLHKHQKQALTFMLQRESGWDLKNSQKSKDLWKSYIDSYGDVRYQNILSKHSQVDPPDPFHGGILADEMGLGKTCTMLSLIASNPHRSHPGNGGLDTLDTRQLKATLIVVPFGLLQVWEIQIERHFHRSAVKLCSYYGQGRQKYAEHFKSFDIVITTYNTVASEWKAHKSSRKTQSGVPLFSNIWHRIVLDEAHMIRTRRTAIARSASDLEAKYRWCITGTPIQNRLSDLSSLLQFLKVAPYGDPKIFESEISLPWKNKTDENALRKLQLLMRMITIRRPRTIIDLPERNEIVQEIDFRPDEASIYEEAKIGTLKVIDSVISSNESAGSAYLNAFQRINDLRYICNHGILPAKKKRLASKINGSDDLSSFQEELDDMLNSATLACAHCGTDIQEEIEFSKSSLEVQQKATSDIPIRLCRECSKNQSQTASSSPFSSESSESEDTSNLSSMPRLSSKTVALVSQLLDVPLKDKSAVFSYWTSTLDTIERTLKHFSISFVRYDGTMSKTKRDAVLSAFATNPSINVILVSITCGGQGLDLTSANHAFLVEPQWNPMLEEQAMSRVHRIGQKKPVRLMRFIVRNTWEERIVDYQERKRTLAGLVVDCATLKNGVDGRKQLLHLRELVK